MRVSLIIITTFLLMMHGCDAPKRGVVYPETQKTDVTDDYFGTAVPDPYRWLEDDNSEETKAWVTAQNEVTFGYLESIPERGAIRDRLEELWNYPKMSSPYKTGKYYFYYKNDGLQNQSVLYYTESPEEDGEVLLDPNTFSEDGTVSLGGVALSDDSKYLAYSISRGGSDWREIYVKNVETGEILEDHIEWVKFSGMSWYKDGFFYNRYPKPEEGDALKGENKNAMVYYHKVGTPQSEDILIYKDDNNPEWGFGAEVSEDDKWLVIYVTESTSGNAFYLMPVEEALTGSQNITPVVESFDKDYNYLTSVDGTMYFYTNFEAPKYKIIALNPENPARENWTDFVPEKDNVLTGGSYIGGKFFMEYLEDAKSLIEIYFKDGSFDKKLDLPLIGSVGGFNGEPEDEITFYSVTSFVTPGSIYKYNIESGESELFYNPEIDFDVENYEVKQVFYPSADGTEIPMFIVHKKGLELDGNNPTLLYGYGGFNISLTPSFSVTRLIWLENDGVYAVANLRGGGEYGEEWHQAGTKLNKQNVFDDFISAAEYLIEEDYTNNDKLTIMGGSNGGLLVGAVTNQRPELFEVAFPAVGVMDMLRYHNFTIGRYWATDYGTSEDNKEMFDYLHGYSPLHNISEGKEYPAVMVTSADHDDRVVPAHSFKYIATLQEKDTGDNPKLIRIAVKAGHGAGKPTSMVIDEYADLWAFAFHEMNVDVNY
ncbi:MAG: prolyl oligopeptidase family serine peptidase [Bacteroidota bacterium]